MNLKIIMKNKKSKFVNAIFAGVSLGILASSLIFVSGSMTGNIIGNMTKQGSGLFGGLLFILGLIGVFAFTREKF
jgi:hypothetical protein